MIIKRRRGNNIECKEDIFNDKGIGNNKAISISKTRKITANKKNRKEKGSRALFLGSNPHSKELDFSRSFEDFEEITKVNINRIKGILKDIENIIKGKSIKDIEEYIS